MIPAARLQAAIEILDVVNTGQPAERVLTGWARRNRFAGSKDRLAIRDAVYGILRTRRSCAAFGGGEGGRALVLGHCRQTGIDEDRVFSGQGYAPPPLTDAEKTGGSRPEEGSPIALDCPDWLWPKLQASLASEVAAVLSAMRQRAPLFVRVNLTRASRQEAQEKLAGEGIATISHELSPSALEVTDGARKVQSSKCYETGIVELQDAASQAVSDLVPLEPGEKMLDFCAGGGGKTLAVAGRVGQGAFFVHDIDKARMRDVPARAKRAGVDLSILSLRDIPRHIPFRVVLVDAPCSGSGTWRRDPEAKWRLKPDDLVQLQQTQLKILADCAGLVASGSGRLVYVTCSVLKEENQAVTTEFLSANSGWALDLEKSFSLLQGADGFYCAVLYKR